MTPRSVSFFAPLLLVGLAACSSTPPSGPGTGGDTPAPDGALLPWPGPTQVDVVDPGGVFEENLSGLTYEPGVGGVGPGVLWAVRNGPSNLFRMVWDEAAGGWVVPAEGGWTLRYTAGTGVPDAEGVTRVPSGPWAGIYVGTERDNGNRDVSRNSILRFEPSSTGSTGSAGSPGSLSATHEWNLTGTLPSTGANRGVEAMAWISDEVLMESGFVDPRTGTPYAPNYGPASGTSGPGSTGGGVFVVGVENTGHLHFVTLNHNTTEHTYLGWVDTGLGAVMALHYDAELGDLWAACDNVCDGRIAVLRIGSDGAFAVDRVHQRPAGMANLNNEGIALAPLSECQGGVRPFYWTDDDETDGHSLRRGFVRCP